MVEQAVSAKTFLSDISKYTAMMQPKPQRTHSGDLRDVQSQMVN